MVDWDVDEPIHKATTKMNKGMKNSMMKMDYTLSLHFIALLS